MAKKKAKRKKKAGGRRTAASSRGASVVRARAARGRKQAARRVETPGGAETGLARELLGLYQQLGRLSRATKDREQRQELRAQQEQIGTLIDTLIGRTIREDTREYVEAGKSLAAAAESVSAAMEDVRGVVAAIVAAARVVDVVGRVVGIGSVG